MSWNKVSMFRGVIESVTAKAKKLMTATVTGKPGEKIEDRRVFGIFGIQSNPSKGTEVIGLRQGNSIVIIASDNKEYRMELKDNDLVLYSSLENFIKLKGAGGIEVHSKDDVMVNADSIKLGGNTNLDKLVTEKVLSLLAAHLHTINPDGTIAPSSTLGMLATNPIYKTSILEAK